MALSVEMGKWLYWTLDLSVVLYLRVACHASPLQIQSGEVGFVDDERRMRLDPLAIRFDSCCLVLIRNVVVMLATLNENYVSNQWKLNLPRAALETDS